MSEPNSDDVISDFPFTQDEGEKGEFTCSTCGEKFDTKRGKNIHVGQMHSE